MSLKASRNLHSFPKNTRENVQMLAELSGELGYSELQVVIAAAVKMQMKVTRTFEATKTR